MVDANRNPDTTSVVDLPRELAVGKCVDDPPDRFLGVVLDVAHVRVDDVEPVVVDHPAQLGGALLTRRHLGLQVGHVLIGIASRVRTRSEQGPQFVLAEPISEISTKLSISTPSCSTDVLFAGADPGVIPPMSA